MQEAHFCDLVEWNLYALSTNVWLEKRLGNIINLVLGGKIIYRNIWHNSEYPESNPIWFNPLPDTKVARCKNGYENKNQIVTAIRRNLGIFLSSNFGLWHFVKYFRLFFKKMLSHKSTKELISIFNQFAIFIAQMNIILSNLSVYN